MIDVHIDLSGFSKKGLRNLELTARAEHDEIDDQEPGGHKRRTELNGLIGRITQRLKDPQIA
jgi:hypothetical protein